MNFVENICALTPYGANASDAGSSPVLMLTSRAIGNRLLYSGALLSERMKDARFILACVLGKWYLNTETYIICFK